MEMRLGIWDYVMIVLSLVLCAGIGLLVKQDSNKGISNYLLAGRSMNVIPVAFSIMATLLSAIAMAGGVGEMYLYGVQFQILTLAGTISKVIVAFLVVPVFHNMEYTSVYEYLEKRFDRMLRVSFSALYILCNVAYLGIVLYLPALALTTVSGIPFWVTTTSIGVICTFYCVLGGFKAVIWTDVVQTVLMFTCIVVVFVLGMLDYGSWTGVWQAAYEGGQLNLLWTEDTRTRYSVWSLFAAGFLGSVKDFATNQAGIQRLLSVKNVSDARMSIYISSGLMLLFKILLVILGVVIFACLSRCDPLSYKESNVDSLDQVLIFAIWKYLTWVPGLAGLAFSGIISGSLSTYSSYINSFATLTLEDYLKYYCPKLTSDEKKNIVICKFLTGVYGLVAILISFGVPYLGGANKAYSILVNSTGGPLAGVMCLGFFITRANAKVAKLALLLGVAPVAWIAVMAQIFPTDYRKLSFGLEACPHNYTVVEEKVFNSESSFDLPLYHISFMWYSSIGFSFTLLSGILLGFFIGGKEEIDPKLLSPIILPRKTPKEQIQLK